MFEASFTGIGRYTFELVENLQRLSREDYKASATTTASIAKTSASVGAQTTAKTPGSSPSDNSRTSAPPQVSAQIHEYVLFFNDPEYSNYEPKEPNFKKVLVNARHYSIKEQTTFLKAINAENLDIMHFTHFNAPILYRKPFVVTIHDLTHTLFPGRKMTSLPYRLAYKAVVKNAVKKSKRIIAISQNTKNDLIKMLNADPAKIDVVYEGVNSEFHQFTPDEKSIAAKALADKYGISEPFLLYTGVHRYHKNLPRLVEAFAKIAANANAAQSHTQPTQQATRQVEPPHANAQAQPPLSLVITGKSDPLYQEAENLTKSLNLEDRIFFTGLIPEQDIVALYNLAKIYVFPSLYEGFGLPVLEAMACGTPVCASNVSSIPEIAGKSQATNATTTAAETQTSANALLFDPYDVDDIALKITTLLEDADLRKTLIQRGLSRIRDFSWEKMSKEILAVYTSAQVRNSATPNS